MPRETVADEILSDTGNLCLCRHEALQEGEYGQYDENPHKQKEDKGRFSIRGDCPCPYWITSPLFLEVVDEGGYALHGLLARFLYLDDKLHVGLDGTAEVLYLIQ